MGDENKKSGTDTGSPGFDIDGKTYTMDVGPIDGPMIGGEPTSHGDMTVDHELKDISKGTKETLADYLGKKTARNRFPVDGLAKEVSFTLPDGTPAPLKASENSHVYAPREQLDRGHHELKEDPRVELKGAPDGHGFYKDLSEASKPQKYVSSILSNNRFTVSNEMIGDAFKSPNAKYDPRVLKPNSLEMGVHPKQANDATFNNLAQVGHILGQRASQELNSSQPGFNPTGAGAEAGALLPSLNQLGTSKINVELLTARDALTDLTNEDIPDANFISPGKESWGQLNNVYDQFSGFKAVGMIALASVLVTTVVATFEGLSALIGLIPTAPMVKNDLSGRYIMGASAVEKNSNPAARVGLGDVSLTAGIGESILGIRSTVAPFQQALKKGVEVYFGFDGSLLDGVKHTISSPGHNIVTARAIIRSSTQTIEILKGVFSSANPVAAASNALEMAQTLKNSKFMAAINIFSQLGDRALTQPDDELQPTLAGEAMKRSSVDSISDLVPEASVMKSRMRNSLKLAWAGNRAHSLHLLPSRIVGMSLATQLGGFQTGIGLQEEASRLNLKMLDVTDKSKGSGRLPQALVEEIESKLEGDYMPFYFHDLRTNEITAFHAFITAIHEAYQSEYEQTAGFGRVEPVKTYKGTTRTISLSFMMVSTSESDFNDMWVKINKLTTLLYPQYTQGRSVSTGDGSEFVQPFSQMVGASPLIRLRLGDLIRSNYSRFALARLFGAGSKSNLNMNGDVSNFETEVVQETLRTKMKLGSGGWISSTTGISVDSPAALAPIPSLQHAAVFSAGADSQYLPVRIISEIGLGSIVGDDSFIVTPRIIDPSDLVQFYGMDMKGATAKVAELKRIYDNVSHLETRVIGGKYKVPRTSLRPGPVTAASLIQDLVSNNADNILGVVNHTIDVLQDFMDPKNNALVKSFESVKGKGLAGVITDFSINWYEGVTWEVTPGSKAPKMAHIDMSFSPIHDVSPGLDSAGFNRAPLYPVGVYHNGPDKKK